MDRIAFADDSRHPLVAVRCKGLRKPFRKAALFAHEALAIAYHDIVQAYGLTHQIGNHRKESHVLVAPESRGPVPTPTARQRATPPVAFLDRTADERDCRAVPAQLGRRPLREE